MPLLPSSVEMTTGRGGLPLVRVSAPSGSAELYLHGAHLTAWAPTGHAPVLWMSELSQFSPEAAIRGGVPICFPWFGAHPDDPGAPSHGFARLREWELVSGAVSGQDVTVTLRLTDDDATRSAWPHRFEAFYRVTVGERVVMALEVVNRDTSAVRHEAALHTYLAVDDVTRATLGGLQGAPFLDRLGGPDPSPGEDGPVTFTGETDRIYLDAFGAVEVNDTAAGRITTVSKVGSGSTVVWNPWTDKAATMADLGPEGWRTMLCVETCNVRTSSVTLQPGTSHTMTAVLEVRRADQAGR